LKNGKGLKKLIRGALREDIGKGDITFDVLFEEDFTVTAILVAKEEAVLCGLDVFREVFLCLSENCSFSFGFKDGDMLPSNVTVGKIKCSLKTMMAAERTALNFLQRLSGIATETRRFVERAGRLNVYDTRKTTPLFRDLEKYAVKTGGGINHRFGLYDMVLIKDNHIYAAMQYNRESDRAKAISEIVGKAKSKVKGRYMVEVEVENFREAREAFIAGADIIMFDNADVAELKKFVEFLGPERKKIEIEWSGNVTLKNVGGIKNLPVDRVSVGALTHSAGSVDFSLKLKG